MQQRDVSIDVAKAIGILLVLYGHFLEMSFLGRTAGSGDAAFVQWQAIYAFHMPLFYLLSGMTNARIAEQGLGKVAARCLGFHLLALSSHIVGMVFFAERIAEEDLVYLIAFFGLPALFGYDYSSIIVWFLTSLAIVQLFVYALARARGRAMQAVIAAVVLSLVLTAEHLAINPFQIQSLLPGTAFFLMGMWFAGRELPLRPSHLGGVALAGFVLVAVTAPWNSGCFATAFASCGLDQLNGRFAVWLADGEVGFVPLYILSGLAGSVAVLALSRLIVHTPFAAGFGSLGRKSLALLLLNGFALILQAKNIRPDSHLSFGPLETVLLFSLYLGAHLMALRLLGGPISVCMDHIRRHAHSIVLAVARDGAR